MENTTFIIRAYGRTELGQLYSPDVSADTAWRRLRQWIHRFPGLCEKLQMAGYTPRQRTFTPAQTMLIIEALGEP